MNWQVIYDSLCESRRSRGVLRELGFEVHHILPSSLGGDNSSLNLVKLTAREHVVAHLLLERMYRSTQHHYAMCRALHRTTHISVDHQCKKVKLTSKQVYKLRVNLGADMQNRQNAVIDGGLTRAQVQNRALNKRKIDTTQHKFYHDVYGPVKASCHDLAIKYKLSSGNLLRVVDKCRFSEKGWYLYTNFVTGLTLERYDSVRRGLHALKLKQKSKPDLLAIWRDTKIKFISKIELHETDELLVDPLLRVRRPVLVCPHCKSTGTGSFMVVEHFDNCRKRKELPTCSYCGWQGDHRNYHKSHEDRCKLSPNYTPPVIKKTICPHCKLEGAVNLLKRYHFDNCKTLKLTCKLYDH